MTIKIAGLTMRDIRFPTSRDLDGPDAMNSDPDYSAACVELHTSVKIVGCSLTFTIGRGTEIVVGVSEVIAACPHVGGVGLCEHVKHLQRFDYICVSGTMENRIVENVDPLHKRFIYPVNISGGRYMPPVNAG